MSARDKLPEITRRISRNIANGKKARKALGKKVAEMPIRQMAMLPRAFLGRIAPDALAVLALAAATTDGAQPASWGAISVERRARDTERPLPLWAVSIGAALFASGIAAFAAAAERPVLGALERAGVLSPEQAALCARLDQWTDGCSYDLGNAGLPLTEVAGRLAMSVADLAEDNPGLPIDQPLPAHAVVQIHRSKWR